MANKSICSVGECGKASFRRGLCSAHYTRLIRHGSTDVIKKPRGEAIKFFNAAIEKRTSECIEWPYTKTKGYPWVSYEGKGWYAHRLACFLIHGEPPSRDHQSAHSCGNNVCINPAHIRWATPKENASDKIIHGTSARGERQGSSKLTEDDVREIRYLEGIISVAKLAKRFDVGAVQIRRIQKRERWAWLD